MFPHRSFDQDVGRFSKTCQPILGGKRQLILETMANSILNTSGVWAGWLAGWDGWVDQWTESIPTLLASFLAASCLGDHCEVRASVEASCLQGVTRSPMAPTPPRSATPPASARPSLPAFGWLHDGIRIPELVSRG